MSRPHARRAIAPTALDTVVRELNELQRGATLDLALGMGELVIKRLYGGDIDWWRRHTTSDASFRLLAKRSGRDLRISASTLYRAIALFELGQRIGISALKNLTTTHLCAVLGLPEAEQLRLLSEADAESWTTRRLEEEAAKTRARQTGVRGPKRMHPLLKVVSRVGRTLAESTDVIADAECSRSLDGVQTARIVETLREVRVLVGRIEELLNVPRGCA